MKKKRFFVCVTLITAIFLINTSSVFCVTDVNVTNTSVPIRFYGTYDLYSYSTHSDVVGSTGSGTQIFGNLSQSLAYIRKYTLQTFHESEYIYDRLGSMYNNCLTPMTTNLNYYLPVMYSAQQTIGTSTDQIKTYTSIIKDDISSIKTLVQNIYNKLNGTQYMDVSISDNDKSTLQGFFTTVLGFIPHDSDNKDYVLDLTALRNEWNNTSNVIAMTRVRTGYYDLYQ